MLCNDAIFISWINKGNITKVLVLLVLVVSCKRFIQFNFILSYFISFRIPVKFQHKHVQTPGF